MNLDADSKGALKSIIRGYLDKAASSLFVKKSLAIVDESADSRESFTDAAVRISRRISLFIDRDLAQTVYESLMEAIEKIASPQGRRRKSRRVAFCKKVSMQYDGQRRELDSLNLSEGGIFIRAKDPLPAGAEMKLTLPLELGRSIPLTGVVIHRRDPSGETSRLPSGMGIEFKGISDDEAEMLRDYIRKVRIEPSF